MIIFIYAVLLFLVLRFTVTLFNFLSNPKLSKYGRRFTDSVSIIVSSVNQDTSMLLSSIKKQDYTNLEVIFLIDKEDDHVALSKAKGKYLLFLDSDLVIGSGLINNLIYRTKVFNLGSINIMPTNLPSSLYDWCVVPLKDLLTLNLYPLRLIRFVATPGFAKANTGCMFCSAEDFELNRQGEKVEVLLASRLLYRTPNRGQSRDVQLLQVFGDNIFAAIIYVILAIVGPLVMFVYFEPGLAVLPIGLIFLSKVMISFLTNQNPLINVLLHPLQMGVLAWKILEGIFTRLRFKVR